MKNEEKKLLNYKQEKKDDYERYKPFIENALNNNYLIAITGSFGAGKTSLIETHIKNKAKREGKEETICSVSILNCNNLDEMSVKIIRQLESYMRKTFNILGIKLAIIFLITLVTVLFKKELIIFFEKNSNVVFTILLIILIIIYFYCFISSFVQIYDKVNLKKFKLSSMEVELDVKLKENNNNYLDIYSIDIVNNLYEIESEFIIFEDFDRNELVMRGDQHQEELISLMYSLRELLMIYNNKYKKKKKRFIFLIDIKYFDNVSQFSKYFDISIPVLPYYSASSLKKVIKKDYSKYIADVIDPDIINILNYRLDDIRVLKIIINDYILTSELLDYDYNLSSDLQKKNFLNRVFSLSIYKSILPNDYNDLLKGKGVIHSVFFDVEKNKPSYAIDKKDYFKTFEDKKSILKKENKNYLSIIGDLIKQKHITPSCFNHISIIHETQSERHDSDNIMKIYDNEDIETYELEFYSPADKLDEISVDNIINYSIDVVDFVTSYIDKFDDETKKKNKEKIRYILYNVIKFGKSMDPNNKKALETLFLKINSTSKLYDEIIAMINDIKINVDERLTFNSFLYSSLINHPKIFERHLFDFLCEKDEFVNLFDDDFEIELEDKSVEQPKEHEKVKSYIEEHLDFKKYSKDEIIKFYDTTKDKLKFHKLEQLELRYENSEVIDYVIVNDVIKNRRYIIDESSIEYIIKKYNINTLTQLKEKDETTYNYFIEEVETFLKSNCEFRQDETHIKMSGYILIMETLKNYKIFYKQEFISILSSTCSKTYYNDEYIDDLAEIHPYIPKDYEFKIIINTLIESGVVKLNVNNMVYLIDSFINRNQRYIVEKNDFVTFIDSLLENQNNELNMDLFNDIVQKYNNNQNQEKVKQILAKNVLLKNNELFIKLFLNINDKTFTNIEYFFDDRLVNGLKLEDINVKRLELLVENNLFKITNIFINKLISTKHPTIYKALFNMSKVDLIKKALVEYNDINLYKSILDTECSDVFKLELLIFFEINFGNDRYQLLEFRKSIFKNQEFEKIVTGNLNAFRKEVNITEDEKNILIKYNFIKEANLSKNSKYIVIINNSLKKLKLSD